MYIGAAIPNAPTNGKIIRRPTVESTAASAAESSPLDKQEHLLLHTPIELLRGTMSEHLSNTPNSNPDKRDPYQYHKQEETPVEKTRREVSDKVDDILSKK